MPELPEVETIRVRLAAELPGRRIVAADAHPSAKFAHAVEAAGSEIVAVNRRGKYLLVELDDDHELVVHLGMTGQFRVHDAPLDDPYVRAWWELDDGRVLVFRDVRRFGRLAVVESGSYASLPTLHEIGPEPFDPALDAETFWRNINRTNRRVKTDLLSQRPIAGVGNIYADEGLWLAQVHPALRRITRAQAERLLTGVRDALQSGLDHGGTTLRDYRDADGAEGGNQHELQCYGRAEQPCQRCGDLLKARVYDARTTTFCPTCQKR